MTTVPTRFAVSGLAIALLAACADPDANSSGTGDEPVGGSSGLTTGTGNNGSGGIGGGSSASAGGDRGGGGGTAPGTGGAGGTSGGDEYFRMDYSEAAAPTAGWSLGFIDPQNLLGVQFFSTLVPGAGPSGQNVYRSRVVGGQNTEFGVGFHGHPFDSSQRGPGTEVFTRFRFKPNGNIFQDGYNGQKIIMVFPEDPGPDARIGLILQPWEDGYAWRGSHGGDLICQTPAYTDWDQWSSVQVSWTYETAPGNGSVRVWRNNNDYANPTASSIADVTVAPGVGSAPHYYVFNGYQTLDANADAAFEITDFEIGPTFESM
jgi:hypothetical protein